MLRSNELQRLLPKFNGKVPPEVETEVVMAFQRVYDVYDLKLKEILNEFEGKLSRQIDITNELLNGFASKLIGQTNDTVLTVINSGAAVTQIIPGINMSISPGAGVGAVTINNTFVIPVQSGWATANVPAQLRTFDYDTMTGEELIRFISTMMDDLILAGVFEA